MLKKLLPSWSRHGRKPGRNGSFSRRRPLCLEQLEPRLVLATFLVTDSGDTAGAANDVTLRYAITQANALGGTNTILFAAAVTKIDLASALPTISGNLIIAGPGPAGLTIDRSVSAGTDFGILSLQANNVLIEGVTLSGGNPSYGGAIYNDGSTLTVNNATIENNTATDGEGGGIYNYAGALTVSHSTIEDNTAPDGGGGGIYSASYNATTISDTLLAGNSAAYGGGLANQEYSENTSAVTLTRVTLYNNTATEDGGGIYNQSPGGYGGSASISATDCTIYDNQAEYAAGIDDEDDYYYDNNAWVSATNCTVYGNISSSGGAGIEVDGGDAYATLENTIVAGNTEDGTPLDFNGELSDQGHNLVQAPGSTSFTASGDVTGVSPGVLTYANNGGFTPTLALASNSPAIAAGNPAVLSTLTVDQRGFARSSDGIHVDIGAYEYGSTGVAPSFTGATSTTFTTGTLDSFSVAANGAPAPLVTESGTLPAGVWFDSTTDTLVGTPVAGTTGTYGLTFSAENGGTPVTQSFTLTVFDGTSIAISLLPGTTIYGQSVTLTATVTSVSGVTPSGTVTFRDDGTMLGASPVTLNDSGVATLVLPTLTAGTHAITASYPGYSGGGNNFAASATTPGPNSIIATVAGNGSDGYGGDGGAATATSLQSPFGVAVDAAGDIFIADTFNNRIREVVKATGNIITVAGTNFAGFNGDGIAATAASLDQPNGVAVDAAGDIFIADSGNNRVREVVKATGDIITIAGTSTAGYNGDGIAAVGAELDYPRGVAVGATGDVFIADSGNYRIREVSGGIITTVAGGGGNAGNDGLGDGGAATAASLFYPTDIAVDASGDLFIADTNNGRIREVSGGVITTVAGGGSDTVRLGDGGPATAAYLSGPQGVAVDAAGDVFIADSNDYRVREVIAATGNIVTVAGTGDSDYTYNGDGVAAGTANLEYPTGVAVDAMGNLFIADYDGQRIREVASGGLLATVAPAALTVTANNASIAYGASIPTLSGTVSGVFSGDGITASYATTATSESTPGNYTISATLNDPDDKLANYVVTNTPGTLTIEGVIASITPGTSLEGGGYITNSGTFALQGYAVPHDTIDIKKGATILGGATAASNGAWSFVVFEPAGAYTFSEVDSNPTINYDDTESLAVTVDETAPTVTLNSLTSPTTNNQPTLSGYESISAPGYPPGTLHVSLYSGTSVNAANLLGTTFNIVSDYSATPTAPLADGTYTAQVSETDDGNTGFSQAVTFTVDTHIPAAPTIVEPASAVVTAANSYTIQGTAQANSLVSVYTNSGGTLVTSEQLSGGATSFSLPVPLASNAASTFTVTATDALGDASPAATVPTITQGAATASLVSNDLNAAYGQAVTYTATVSGSVNTPTGTVSLYDGSTLLVSGVSLTAGVSGIASATFDSSSFTAPLAVGPHLLTVAYSGDSNFAAAVSAAIDETIGVPPVVTLNPLTSPTNANQPILRGLLSTATGDVLTGAVSLYSGTGVNPARLYLSPADFTMEYEISEFNAIPNATLPDGTYTAQASQSDISGDTGFSAAVTFTVDTHTPATPTVASPGAALATNAATATIAGTAEANSLVQVYLSSSVVASEQLSGGNTQFSIVAPLTTNSANVFSVTATDAAGTQSASATVPTITQDSIAPAAPTITEPAAAVLTPVTSYTIEGTAEANSLVSVYTNNGATLVTSEQLSGGGTSFAVPVLLAPGAANNFTVTATDAAGNPSTAATVPTITQGTPVPISNTAFALLGPSAGTYFVGQGVTIAWTAAGVDVAGPTKISLGYDTDPTAFDAHEKWIEIDGVTAANGAGSYSWNTSGVAAGTYYLAGYMYDFSTETAVFSSIGTPIVIATGSPPAFTLLGPSAGTFSVGQSVTIQWTAAGVDVAGPTKISLGYDADPTAFDAHEKWIEIDGVTAANGAASYSWNTAGVTSGTYYLSGYMYDFSTNKAVFSQLGTSIVFTVGVTPPPTAFTLNGPSVGTFTAGQTVTIQWTATSVDVSGPSKISLGYDADTTAFDGNEHWIEVDHVTAANGAASYLWNTAGMASGTYYLSGYMYDFSTSKAIYSSVGTSIVITGGVPTTFTLLGPSAGAFTAGTNVTIAWTATNVDTNGPSKISLGYDKDATVDGNEHWIEIDGVTAANGAGSYVWNTTGVAAGTYYLGGYMYDFTTSQAIYSSVATTITITSGAAL
jgi:hypothetical protein